MDWKTFIVEFTQALAWPIVFLLLIYCFRHTLKGIIERVTRFQYKDTVVEFQRGIAHMQETLQSSPELAKSINKDERHNPILELQNLPPRSAIIEAWLILEAVLDKVYYEHFPGDNKQPLIKKLRRLYKEHLMNDKAFEIISKLRELRNSAVHEVAFSIPKQTLNSYLEVVFKIYDAVNPK